MFVILLWLVVIMNDVVDFLFANARFDMRDQLERKLFLVNVEVRFDLTDVYSGRLGDIAEVFFFVVQMRLGESELDSFDDIDLTFTLLHARVKSKLGDAFAMDGIVSRL